MSVPLSQILTLVGSLDDAQGKDTPRERFRIFLAQNLTEVGQIRDYVQECLMNKGDQFSRALQDLVNHIGRFMGFEVTDGRYQGVRGEIGFDGLWKSPTGLSLVVEAKTTEVYTPKTSALVGYVDELISEKKIPDWENAMGLYVVGRPDPEVHSIENAIVAEKRTEKLRIISVESLLSLAELMNEYDIAHADLLAVLRPSGPRIDPVAQLLAKLAAQTEEPGPEPKGLDGPPEAVSWWLTPVTSDEDETAEQVIESLVGREGIYAFGERTPGRRHLKPGDFICFYATGIGVVAHAKVTSKPENKPHPKVRQPERYPWTFHIGSQKLYLNKPIVIDAALRSRLEVFASRDPAKGWAWFVQATRRVAEHDFKILTRQAAAE